MARMVSREVGAWQVKLRMTNGPICYRAAMRLFHFSEDGGIGRFEPRAVRVPSVRAVGREWLNGPLVWAVEEARQGMYLFPRDCPRVVLWALPGSTKADLERWGAPEAGMIACVEPGWMARILSARLYRYELAAAGFECLDDAGMWVSRDAADIVGLERIDDLAAEHARVGVTLRAVKDLKGMGAVWESSLHASGIRLRNAGGG